jgi:hypothetical protein
MIIWSVRWEGRGFFKYILKFFQDLSNDRMRFNVQISIMLLYHS